MLKNGGGSIIITSSIGGEKGFAYESLYCMTKGAVLQLARSIAVEYRDMGIRCNAICPGFVKTNHGLREIKELDNLEVEHRSLDELLIRLREEKTIDFLQIQKLKKRKLILKDKINYLRNKIEPDIIA